MIRRKHAIIRTNICKQLDIAWWNILIGVFNQMDEDLYWSSLDMIVAEVNNATPASIDEDCIRDIMKLL